MALLNLGEDPWILEHDSCEKLCRDIMGQLMQREALPRKTDKYAQVSANIRIRLKQYKNEVGQLKQKLDQAAKISSITAAEFERRTRQIEVLHSRATHMEKMFDEQVTSKMQQDRQELIGDASVWGPSYSRNNQPDASNYSVDTLREDQQNMLQEQEAGLESLSQIISRQKNIAQTITTEVDLHNEILDDLGTRIDRTDNRVRTETNEVSVVVTKEKTCIYWVTIILLLLSIITVAAL